MQTDVLIVGAGPTGLMLALWLVRLGLKPYIIDEKKGITQESRALGVQAKTLETYEQLGIINEAMKNGCQTEFINVWAQNKHVARISFENIANDLSAYPYLFILGQDKNEALLIRHLQQSGCEVAWQTRLESFTQGEEGLTAILKKDDESFEISAKYLCGCDGARSSVRHLLGIHFPGGTYSHLFYVADVRASGKIKEQELNVCFAENRFHAFFPLPGEKHFRIVGLVPNHLVEKENLTFADVRAEVEERFNERLIHLEWFSTYRVHHRVAPLFQKGNVFLLGDAAHIHSPVGAQGMNTGLMDATNLAWKLAEVIEKREPPSILTTYALERQPFAYTLVNTTDRVFSIATSDSYLARFTRIFLFPLIFKLASHTHFMQRFLFRTISQIRIHYRKSPLSQGQAGTIIAGDRLPWFRFRDGSSNYEPLKSLQYQFHIFGKPNHELEAWCKKNPSFEIYYFKDCPESRVAGFQKDILYLVRPDGYLRFIGKNINEFRRKSMETPEE